MVTAEIRATEAPPERGGAVDQDTTPYLDALRRHVSKRPRNFNVPTHKAGLVAPERLVTAVGHSALAMDIPPAIHGIDTGVDPTPRDLAERLAADAWGAARTWFTLNGASQANHTICLTLAQRGRSVVVQRNTHRSTVDGMVLGGLDPVFVAPELDDARAIGHCVTPSALERVLARVDAPAGVVLVSPTYYGMAADVRALVEVAHAFDVPIAIDEAWGAHFAFHEALPLDAVAAGADLVVSSTHKMLGSVTQSAMLHLGTSARISEDEVERALALTHTTSPNALLAGSLDAARHRAATHGRELLARTLAATDAIREGIRSIPGLEILDERLVGSHGIAAVDPLHLSIDVRASGREGYDLQRALRARGVFVELTSPYMLLAVLGMGEAAKEGTYLVEALREAVVAAPIVGRRVSHERSAPPWGPIACSPRAAFVSRSERVPIEAAVGRVAAETVAVAPPGIPNLLPGERVTGAMVAFISDAVEAGAVVLGCGEPADRTLRVISAGASGDHPRAGRRPAAV